MKCRLPHVLTFRKIANTSTHSMGGKGKGGSKPSVLHPVLEKGEGENKGKSGKDLRGKRSEDDKGKGSKDEAWWGLLDELKHARRLWLEDSSDEGWGLLRDKGKSKGKTLEQSNAAYAEALLKEGIKGKSSKDDKGKGRKDDGNRSSGEHDSTNRYRAAENLIDIESMQEDESSGGKDDKSKGSKNEKGKGTRMTHLETTAWQSLLQDSASSEQNKGKGKNKDKGKSRVDQRNGGTEKEVPPLIQAIATACRELGSDTEDEATVERVNMFLSRLPR